jgi:hypothetical protein
MACSTVILDHPATGAPLLRATSLVVLAFATLLAVRIPSLAQPAGADQGLYAYVGQRILEGEQPYRDAWDQKPPGIHFLYAALWLVWPHESAVPAADLLAAAATAVLLFATGRVLGGPGAGAVAGLVYLLLANPAMTRLGGVRIRAQAETFIALLVTAAMLHAAERWRREGTFVAPSRGLDLLRSAAFVPLVAGVLVGTAAMFKYPAAVYALPVAVLLALPPRISREDAPHGFWPFTRTLVRRGLLLGIGMALPALAAVVHFWYHGALDDFRLATLTYNVAYSGETFGSLLHAVRYTATFPITQARLDPLWFVGGLGCLVLVVLGWRRPHLWVAPLWVGTAAVAIAVNGSRGLPQYFVQAAPALALAAGLAAGCLRHALRPAVLIALAVLVGVGAWRVGDFARGLDYTMYDWRGMTGALDRDTYLARYGAADSGAKFSALAVHRLADHVRQHTTPGDRIFVFGFSPWAYVGSGRASASRWFWSRPVIVGFEAHRPGYGWRGVLTDLRRTAPALVALQRRDWDPVETNSDVFFAAHPEMVAWLEAGYEPAGELHNYALWVKRR